MIWFAQRERYFYFIFIGFLMVHLFVHGFMRPTLRAQTGIASRYTLAKTAWRSYALVSSARFDKPNCVSLIEESVYRQLRPIVKSHTTLLLCISGGSDSMAMLHIMHQIKSKMIPDLNLQVIHFNHKVRVESEVEADMVKFWSNKYNIPFHFREAPVELQHGANFQLRARVWRRTECLQTEAGLAASANNDSYICTAHIHEDHLETLMMSLLRGVHIANFHGIKVVDGPFFKPLLHLPKAQLVQYLQQRGLEWSEDSSNQERAYQRNKVRLDLMPLLGDLAGSPEALSARLTSLSRQSADLKEWIDSECEKWNESIIYTSLSEGNDKHMIAMKPSLEFGAVPKLVLSELLRRWVALHTGMELSLARTEEVEALAREPLPRGAASKAVTVCQRYDVVRVKKHLRLRLRTYASATS